MADGNDMVSRCVITVLAENSVHRPGLLAEHGVSFLVETDGQRVLFDSGQGGVLLKNAHELGISLEPLDALAISHGHYDHTGGLAEVLRLAGSPLVYLHPRAVEPKYSRRDAPPHRRIGIPDPCLHALEEAGNRIIWTDSRTPVGPGVFVTGAIPRSNDFEDTGGPFYCDQDCRQADDLVDDQALVVESAAGLIVLLGCAHAGVVNTLTYVSQLAGGIAVHAVIGGMHLLRAPLERIETTAGALVGSGVREIAPCHCTGFEATSYFRQRFGERCIQSSVGFQYKIP
jgi:7,8-dihydropterin-6-yl-methyl-4-(beta-D-ribofuranosyl)aminobenzene 5'-phosphate synthase